MAETYFQATNTVALLAWVALVLFPGKKVVSGVLCGLVVPALLAVTYAGIIGWKLTANGMPPGDVMTLAGLRDVFTDDWVFAAAWTHYLAFDMVVGAWMARDSVRHQLPWLLRTPALVLTFLAGPVGFLTYVIGRGLLRTSASYGTAWWPIPSRFSTTRFDLFSRRSGRTSRTPSRRSRQGR